MGECCSFIIGEELAMPPKSEGFCKRPECCQHISEAEFNALIEKLYCAQNDAKRLAILMKRSDNNFSIGQTDRVLTSFSNPSEKIFAMNFLKSNFIPITIDIHQSGDKFIGCV